MPGRDPLYCREAAPVAIEAPSNEETMNRPQPAVARRLRRAALAALLPFFAASALAQGTYPNRPLKAVVPYAPGGVSDVSTRTVMERLSRDLGQPIVMENKAGAASTLASNWVASQPPDGYTLYAAPVSIVINPTLQGKVQYDPRASFEPISMMIVSPFVLQVSPALGVRTMKDLVALVRANPDKYTIGTSGAGSINHLAAEYFVRSLDLKVAIAHYRGGMPAVQDMFAGAIHMLFSATNEALPFLAAGRTTGVAVTSLKRLPNLPELPTMEEATGIRGFEAVFWMAVMVPAQTPKPIVARLQEGMARVGASTELREKMATLGVELDTSPAQAVRERMDRDEAKWSKLIRDFGIRETQ